MHILCRYFIAHITKMNNEDGFVFVFRTGVKIYGETYCIAGLEYDIMTFPSRIGILI